MNSTDTDDTRFLADLADRLYALPGVEAVTLGGSRAEGTHRVDSDWDLALYYRSGFDPQDLSDIGWEGKVSGIGEWGGVFNGGAWLRVHGRPVDVHYRDLGVVEHELAEAEQGRFRVEPLMFHLVGIPTYLLLAELALGQVLHGELPRPGYPEALRAEAPRVWRGFAAANLSYAEHNHAPYGRVPVRRTPRPGGRAGRTRGLRGTTGVGHQRQDSALQGRPGGDGPDHRGDDREPRRSACRRGRGQPARGHGLRRTTAGGGPTYSQSRGLRLRKSSAISSKVTQRTPSCPPMYSMRRSCMSRFCGRPDTSGCTVIGNTAWSYSR